MDVAILAGLPFLGLFLATFSSFIGTGGGFLFVPALLLLFPNEAPGNIAFITLMAVLANSLSGASAYGRFRRIDYRSGLILAVGIVPGAIAGAFTTSHLGRDLFQVVFGTLSVLLALYLLFLMERLQRPEKIAQNQGDRTITDVSGHVFTYRVRYDQGIIMALVIGFIGGMLGIGGGPLLVTGMVGFLGFPMQIAAGTSQFTLVLSALAGGLAHLSQVNFHDVWLRALLLVLGVAAGAQIGPRLAYRASPRPIQRVLAAAMILVGAWLIAGGL